MYAVKQKWNDTENVNDDRDAISLSNSKLTRDSQSRK
jgi:hypothetical protein